MSQIVNTYAYTCAIFSVANYYVKIQLQYKIYYFYRKEMKGR